LNTTWEKSSYCGTNACVEVTVLETNPIWIAVRNNLAPDVKVLFTEDEWKAFIAGVKAGEFDI